MRESLVTSLEAGLKLDDLSMAYLTGCTKRETFFNDLQYLAVGLGAVQWPPPSKWSSAKSRGTIVSTLKGFFYQTLTVLLNISL